MNEFRISATDPRTIKLPDEAMQCPVFWWDYNLHEAVYALNRDHYSIEQYADFMPLDDFAKSNLIDHLYQYE